VNWHQSLIRDNTNTREMRTLLSIVIPLYNGEKVIENLILSILEYNQEPLFEIIIVDDGSIDKSFEVCHRLKDKYNEIKLIIKENGGIASARNAGLKNAIGKYVTFADQDDLLIDGYKDFVDQCINEDLDLLITSPYNRYENSTDMRQRVFSEQLIEDEKMIKKIAGKLIDGKYLSDDSAPFISTSVWNVIYRRELLIKNDISFKSFIDYEDDWIFNIETLLCAKRIALTSKGYYCWIIRNSSESHRSKHIPELLTKRKNWMNWLSEIIDKLGIPSDKTGAFIREVLIPRNIMMCFNNACWNEKNTKENKLEEIRVALSSKGWDISSVDLKTVKEMTISNRFILFLLKANHLNLAYEINCRVLKNHFH